MSVNETVSSLDTLPTYRPTNEPVDLYLELLKRSVLGLIYPDPYLESFEYELRDEHKRITKLLYKPFNPEQRDIGLDHPQHAHSMIGTKRMNNIRDAVEYVLSSHIPGDFLETGVWRGGACIFMRGILAAHQETSRRVWVADSFEGLPEPNAELYPADAGDLHHEFTWLAVSLEEVKSNFDKYALLDDQVHFLKGWFKDTLPTAPISQLAILRLDGDMYESTMDALTNMYRRVSPGGVIIVDDYNAVASCKQAITDFRTSNAITAPIQPIDTLSVYWIVPRA
jgi:hypothetical protein